jgi:hypothetical protein
MFCTKVDILVKAVVRHFVDNTSSRDITMSFQTIEHGAADDCQASHSGGSGHTHLLPHLPSYASNVSKSSRNPQFYNTL